MTVGILDVMDALESAVDEIAKLSGARIGARKPLEMAMRMRGLEPPRGYPHTGPEPCASTNSATSARVAIVAASLSGLDRFLT